MRIITTMRDISDALPNKTKKQPNRAAFYFINRSWEVA